MKQNDDSPDMEPIYFKIGNHHIELRYIDEEEEGKVVWAKSMLDSARIGIYQKLEDGTSQWFADMPVLDPITAKIAAKGIIEGMLERFDKVNKSKEVTKGVDDMSVLSVHVSNVPVEVLNWFRHNSIYEYMDMSDLREDLINYKFLENAGIDAPHYVVQWVQDYLEPLLEFHPNLSYFKFHRT